MMSRHALRVAVTNQLEPAARAAGFDTYVLPNEVCGDFNRSLDQRLTEGPTQAAFLKQHQIDLVIDFNTAALTLSANDASGKVCITPASLGIPYVSCFLDPVTSILGTVPWADKWSVLESESWIKWVWESAHAEELIRMGIPNVLSLPMAAMDADYDISPLPEPDSRAAVAFMGHPASSWFKSDEAFPANKMLPALTAASVHADLPNVPFHSVYFDLHAFAEPVGQGDDAQTRIDKSADYFNQKFLYNAFLAVKRRDRYARFLKLKLGDSFELIGDHWGDIYGLPHTPRIWDREELNKRIRGVPICINLLKGCLETGMNIRHFEITANGGFMLTHFTPELETCFEIGVECDVFHHEEDLLQKISHYLENPEQRQEMARAGQRRTLSEHLYSHRLQRLVELLRENGILPRNYGAIEETGRCAGEPVDSLVAATTDVMPFGMPRSIS